MSEVASAMMPDEVGTVRRRGDAIRAGVLIECVSLSWMIVEATIAITAGLLAGSVLLTAFGIDSVVELVTGAVLLWRLLAEARERPLALVAWAERRAAWIVGISLVLLCVYVVVSALAGLLLQRHPETSALGFAVACASLLLMPLLAWRKRLIARRIDSAALRGDAACSITCAYMAGTLLVGLAAQAILGWWWADNVAALALLWWLGREAREALEGARAGHGACSCGDPRCDD